MRLHCQAQEKI
ncbi:hypothetical protein LEMLEM_LOCUS7401 [Lemmus lemmus]